MKSPAFQFYVTDYLGSQRVQMLTLEQEGAYIRLLSFCWQHGSIPSNPKEIAKLIGKGCSSNLARVVACMFEVSKENPKRLVHDRLEKERKKQSDWKIKCAAGGRKSAELKKNTPRVVEVTFQDSTRIPSPSSSSSTIPSPLREGETETPSHFQEVQVPSWEEVQAQCQIIGLVEWRAKDWFDEMVQSGWKDNKGREVMNWQSYLTRVKTWWERDGRPMTPPKGKTNGDRPKSPGDLRAIIQAKETKAAAIRTKHCADTAIDSVWNSQEKRKEFFEIKREIKTLNDQLSNMA